MKYARHLVLFILILFLYSFVSSLAFAGESQPSDTTDIESTPLDMDESDQFDDFNEFEKKPVIKDCDPLSAYNRFMTQVNDKLYFSVLKPVAQGYAQLAPEPVRLSIHRFFNNLAFPIRGVNNLIQLKIKCAGIETARFGINTTVGFFGFFDPAKICWSLETYPEDFGQTMGYYGLGPGFHIVWPLLGPSSLRDTCGKLPDLYLNAVNYVTPANASLALSAEDKINTVSLHIGEYETLRKDAVDLYLFLKNAYEKSREKQIKE